MSGSTKRATDSNESTSDARGRKRCLFLVILGLVVAVFWARPALVSYHLWRAAEKLRQHNADLAEPYLARVLELDPENAMGHFLFARLRRRQGSPDTMNEHLEAARKSGFSIDRLEREQQFLLAQTGRFRDLTGSPGELLLNSGEDGSDACEAVVNGLMLTYQLSSAGSVIDAWAADYPNDPQPLFCRGTLSAEQENWQDAILSFRRALDIASDRTDIRVRLADAMKTLRQHKEAIREYRQSVEDAPTLISAYVGLAECLTITAQTDEARIVLEKALQISPDCFEVNLALGKLELDSGNSGLGVVWLQKALEAKKHSVAARYALASALRTVGRSDEAQEHFDRVEAQNDGQARLSNLMDILNKDPKRVESRYEIGMTLLKFGDPAEGAMWLESVFEFDLQHEPTHQALADYYSSVGKDDQAALHRRKVGT
ncbi:MAG: tetratricopeptide repeat protein [Planctomycetota bacterium]|nr:tetratricopeptide repeat protein [Planctomycetota bacterium]